MPTVFELRAAYARPGRVEWMGVRPARAEPMHSLDSAVLLEDRGIQGDRAARKAGGKRQVTLIQYEHLAVIAALTGAARVEPWQLRRNLVVSGFNLLALRKQRFWIGEALLEWTGFAHPCSRMEEALGTGGYTAMRGHGGVIARVVRGGAIRVGDRLAPMAGDSQ